jgi:hypothetical protein
MPLLIKLSTFQRLQGGELSSRGRKLELALLVALHSDFDQFGK